MAICVGNVQPETVVNWHRMGFKLYWRWISKAGRVGRSNIYHEIRALIRRMSQENPIWGAPRILSEMRLLGYDVAQSTVAKYMFRLPKPPSAALFNRYSQFPKSGALHLCLRRVSDAYRRQAIRQVKACHANPPVSHPIIDVEAVR